MRDSWLRSNPRNPWWHILLDLWSEPRVREARFTVLHPLPQPGPISPNGQKSFNGTGINLMAKNAINCWYQSRQKRHLRDLRRSELPSSHPIYRAWPPAPPSLTNGKSQNIWDQIRPETIYESWSLICFLSQQIEAGEGAGSNALSNTERGEEWRSNAGHFLCSFEATNKMGERKGDSVWGK